MNFFRFGHPLFRKNLPQGVEHEKPIFMRFSRKFLIFGSDSEPFSYLSGSWLRNGAIFRLWHQNWCRFRDQNFRRGIKIDAILKSPSLIPSGNSHLARVIFIKIFLLTYFQWGRPFLSSFQKISAHLTHVWGSFCQPIRWEFLLQSLTATFAAEKRHIFRNFFKKASCSYTASFFGRI